MSIIKRLCLITMLLLFVGCSDGASPDAASVAETVDVDAVDTASVATEDDSTIEINFIESAPKDRFVITNMGDCSLQELTLEIDLSQSAGKLIFDTTETGAGVEVFQPFEVVTGDIVQIAADGVQDGDSTIALRIGNLQASGSASFSIDVDDTLLDSELGKIRVAGSEISGGLVQVTVGETAPALANFDDASSALIRLPSCGSS